jgi:lanosterol synthase
MQNPSGGYASYELIRAPKLLELINPAEVFGGHLFETPSECVDSDRYR